MVAPLRDLACSTNSSVVIPLAPSRSAPSRSAPDKLTPPSQALQNCASLKVAPDRLVTVNPLRTFNPLREKESPLLRVLRFSKLCLFHVVEFFSSYGSKLASVRSAPLRSALARLAPLKSARFKFEPSRSAPYRLARLRSAHFR